MASDLRECMSWVALVRAGRPLRLWGILACRPGFGSWRHRPQERAGVFQMFGVPEEPALDLASHINRTMADCILGLYRSAVDVRRQCGPDFAAIPIPGLVIIPSEDPFLTAASATRAAARADAKAVALDGVGHWWTLQDPARAAAVLREFWTTLA